MTAAEEKPARLFRCSFCAKPQTDVKVIVFGPGVSICDECVRLCETVIAKTPDVAAHDMMIPERMTSEHLSSVLAGYNKAYETLDAAMQDTVDLLRERDVSWAEIGKTLGVTRQAAWRRFAAPLE
ncbi:MAG TPA: ClpX C4-type zinc finger protein [Caulobacteraceae bacterium]|nr:ClpX C4-type zinc finger protein [Caulobacteraceae bacterium]